MKKRFGNKALIFILTFMLLAAAAVVVALANTSSGYQYADFIFGVNPDGTTATITGVNLTEMTKEFRIPYTVTDKNDPEKTYTVTAINCVTKNASGADVKKLVFGELTIPSTVTSIGADAFSGTYITGTVDLSNVTSIGSSAFKNCDGITEVILSGDITEIKGSTFEDCFALGKINTENVVTFGAKCFYNCRALYSFSFGEVVELVESEAFYNCDAIDGKYNKDKKDEDYGVFDNSMIAKIKDNAFKKCDKITTVKLPNSNINFNAYNECSNIQGYLVLEDNPDYISVDGVLYSKDGTTIEKYPTTRKDEVFKLSDTVTTITSKVFAGTTNLKEVILTNNVTTIEVSAFTGSSIEFLYIPSSVGFIEYDTFKDCEKLKTVILG